MNDTVGYEQKMKNDLLEQLKGKPNTNAMVSVFAKQFQEVFGVFESLKQNRSLESAAGAQLDGVGDIVVLTRAQARVWESQYKRSSTIDDNRFREYLKYKIFINTNTCTYKDVTKALKMFWNLTPLYYSEIPSEPATMIYETPTVGPDIDTSKLFSIPVIKAAGVRLKLVAKMETPMPNPKVRIAGAAFSGIVATALPALHFKHQYQKNIFIVPKVGCVVQTDMPELLQEETG